VMHAKVLRLWKHLEKPPAILVRVAKFMAFVQEFGKSDFVRLFAEKDPRKFSGKLQALVSAALARTIVRARESVMDSARTGETGWGFTTTVQDSAGELALLDLISKEGLDYESWMDEHTECAKTYRWIRVRSRALEQAYHELFPDDAPGGF
jgi:hypothetical protein